LIASPPVPANPQMLHRVQLNNTVRQEIVAVFSKNPSRCLRSLATMGSMKNIEADFSSMCGKIRFAVDNDPLAAGAYEKIARHIGVGSEEPTTVKDVSDYINDRRPVTNAAQAAIIAFAEKHGIRG